MPSQWCVSGGKTPVQAVEQYVAHIVTESAAVYKEADNGNCFTVERDIPYGWHRRQKLDVFRPRVRAEHGAALIAFVHGGYWRTGSRHSSCFFAKPILYSGHTFAAIDYPNMTDKSFAAVRSFEHNCMDMSKALQALLKMCQDESYTKLILIGYSSGVLTALCMVKRKWNNDGSYFAPPNELMLRYLRGVFLISGVYDLLPLTLTSVNAALKLSHLQARTLSPLHNPNFFHFATENRCRSNSLFVGIYYAEHDPPKFRQQSCDKADVLRSKLTGKNVTVKLEQVPNTDHFTIVEQLTEIGENDENASREQKKLYRSAIMCKLLSLADELQS